MFPFTLGEYLTLVKPFNFDATDVKGFEAQIICGPSIVCNSPDVPQIVVRYLLNFAVSTLLGKFQK